MIDRVVLAVKCPRTIAGFNHAFEHCRDEYLTDPD